MPNTELLKIRTAIRQKNAKWTARETSVSRVAPEVRRRILSQTPFGPVVGARPLASPLPPPPASFDWTNVGGNSYVTAVKSQFDGTCTSFASAAALESCLLRMGIVPQGVDIDLAEHAIVSCPTGSDGNLHGIAAFMKDTGLPPEALFPGSMATAHPGWESKTYRVVGWDCFYPTTVNEVKALLVQNGPVVTTMQCPNDFFSYGGGVYSNVDGLPSSGFHAILVVGYDDAQQCFHCKNSWGASWGEGGFLRISYKEFKSQIVNFGWDIHTYPYAAGPFDAQLALRGHYAIHASSGHFLTAVNGGGIGEAANRVPLHTDAKRVGPWEKFRILRLDGATYALQTSNGCYVTAVKGGGMGEPQNALPLHTDAQSMGPWEKFELEPLGEGFYAIKTANGRYVTAVNGGGGGEAANVLPLHTDTTHIGPWEKFVLVPVM